MFIATFFHFSIMEVLFIGRRYPNNTTKLHEDTDIAYAMELYRVHPDGQLDTIMAICNDWIG